MQRLIGKVRFVYEHGEPCGIRDDSGFICMFNTVTEYAIQEERYGRECKERQEIADFVCKALDDADRK